VKIIKRDGREQEYDGGKIRKAIIAAGGREALAFTVEGSVASFLGEVMTVEGHYLSVEDIQDEVEKLLMEENPRVAKTAILYREDRAKKRSERAKPNAQAVADYIHLSKYSRYNPVLGRRETWKETVTRCEEMHIRRFPDLEEEIRCAFDFVRDKKVFPSARSLQFAGPAIEAVNLRQYNCLGTLICYPRVFAEIFYSLLAGCGVGYSVQYRHVNQLPSINKPNDSSPRFWTIGDSIRGWAEAVEVLMKSYFEPDMPYVEFDFSHIRKKGSLLVTSGGKAPGHIPLKKALERVRSILDEAVGRKLRPIECHDSLCHLAIAVLTGGIRRSSMICHFSVDDHEMMEAKTGDWFKTNPQRVMANNSAVILRGSSTEDRERFDRIFDHAKEYGEPGFYLTACYDYTCNPCQPAWATVLTPQGISTLGKIDIGDTIWSGKEWTKVTNKVYTGRKTVFGYHTRAGVFYGTDNHRVVSEGVKVEAKETESIDTSQGPNYEYSMPYGEDFDGQSIVDGLVLGDGTVHKASNNLILLCIGEKDYDYFDDYDISALIGDKRSGVNEKVWEIETTLGPDEVPLTHLRNVPNRFRFGNSKTKRSFLRGLYSANGSVCSNRVTLEQSSLTLILQVQEMLSSLGIRSYYTVNRPHKVQFSNGEYLCKESYDLNITIDRKGFRSIIGFIQEEKMERLNNAIEKTVSRDYSKKTYDIVEIEEVGEDDVYDITVDCDDHTYWTGGLLVSNCGEASFYPVNTHDGKVGFQACNLTELNGATVESIEDFIQRARVATFIGTLQAAFTDFPFMGSTTEAIVRREALLGVGITGMMDNEIVRNPDNQRKACQEVRETNRRIAELIGINSGARLTVVKPSGTLSLLSGCIGSGIHPHHARRYIRRITANPLEPCFQYFKKTNPHMCVEKPNGDWVIEFPIQAADDAVVVSDLTAKEFMDIAFSTYDNWIVPGTAKIMSAPGLTHNISITVSVEDGEWDEVRDHAWVNRYRIAAMSFLPKTGDKIYPFAPREAITTSADEARWNELIEKYTPVDWTKMVEEEDTTDPKALAACEGGSCLIGEN